MLMDPIAICLTEGWVDGLVGDVLQFHHDVFFLYMRMYGLAFRGHVGAGGCFAYPPSTRAARYSSSYICVGLCIRTDVARYLVLEVPFSTPSATFPESKRWGMG